MSRLLEALKSKRFIGYVTGGVESSVDAALAQIEGGVDLLEVGLPFSDPVADGPVIQEANQRALKEGATPQSVLESIKKIRERSNIPIVLMTYYNPLLKGGPAFYQQMALAGVDGLLVVDLPPEEASEHCRLAKMSGIDLIFLVSPTTSDERLKLVASLSTGFIYYACRKGTTGMRNHLPDDVNDQIQRIKAVTTLPVVIGFGIADRASAAAALEVAEGFVVASAFIHHLNKGGEPQQLNAIAKSIDPRHATDPITTGPSR